MSRIGKKIVTIPSGVDIKVQGETLVVKGPKGTLSERIHPAVKFEIVDRVLTVVKVREEKGDDAVHGLMRSLTANMITGVTEGYQRILEIVGVGYRAQVQGAVLTLNVGYSSPVNYPVPKGIEVDASGKGQVTIKGIDKRLVGTVAAELRAIRPPEPYKGKGIKYSDERIRRKVGKTGA
jgi:large subunit ribosomal protein L6